MSATDPPQQRPGIKKPAPLFSAATFVETNSLLRSAIQTLPADVRGDIVLRCDEMARLHGSEEAISKAFSQLLQMIIEERETGKKLFLHITCSKKKNEKRLDELQHYLVQFHTNLTPHATWKQDVHNRINSISALLLPYGGSLLVNQLKNSGCMFCITLPGK